MKNTLYITTLILFLLPNGVTAQCDFVNDITGITMSTPPAGDASDPLLYTQVYVLVDSEGNIVATGATTDFIGLIADLYFLYAVNYVNTEAASIVPLLAVSESFSTLQAYFGCIDISDPYGNCTISVCDQVVVVENSTITNTSNGFTTTGHAEEYCLICNDIILASNTTGTFDLSLYPAAAAAADCQVVSMNYQIPGTAPVLVGDNWDVVATGNCDQLDCWEYIARDLDITSILSIELIDFSGKVENEYNFIHWTTKSEKDNSHFILERSPDGIVFEPIHQIAGNGTTLEEHHYSFDDFEIAQTIYYYRLVSVDFNGETNRSQVIALSRSQVGESSLVAYPIPANESVNLTFNSNLDQRVNIELHSLDGKLILRKGMDCDRGVNNLTLQISNLAQGAYYVTAYFLKEDKRLSTKIIR
jgi:hypothetical protein